MRRLSSWLMAIALLISMSVAFAESAGTSADPLVTLSYLKSDVIPVLNGAVYDVIKTYENDNAHDMQAERMYNDASARIIPEGYSFTSSYVAVNAPKGSSVTLLTGGSFILISGEMSLVAERGEVINVNTAETASETLRENIRYFATESAMARYTASKDSMCLISGPYVLENGAAITENVHFSDLNEGDIGFKAAVELCKRGIMSSVSGLSFEPKTDITIETLIEAIWILAGSPGDNAKTWAEENEIWSYSDSEDVVTHEELAYILYRYAKLINIDTEASLNLEAYADHSDVTPEYSNAVAWAFEKGILTGSIDTVLEPGDHSTRIQSAMAIHKLIQIIE